ncbi:unnamed protein product [Symbiodinium sp. CCMP2592]|nr:unnamed protein product [Symbiodinium sp. CCMP2592]
MPVPKEGWSHFPPVLREGLQAAYGHPLVAWELLDSDEGLEDLLAAANLSDPEVTSACRDALRKLRDTGAGAKRQAYFRQCTLMRCPRLPSSSDELRIMQDCFQDIASVVGQVQKNRRRSHLGISLQAGIEDPEQLEQQERGRWQHVLAGYIEEADLPVMELIRSSETPSQVWSRIFGSRRAKTLRNRAKTWKGFHLWLTLVKGTSWPQSVLDVTDYLEHRIAEGCGVSVPRDVLSSLSLLENVGRIAGDDRLGSDPTLNDMAKAMGEELERGAPPKKPAKLCTVAMLISMELCVIDDETAPFMRILAWIGLLMHWGVLRTDDVQWLDVCRMVFTDNGLTLVLRRSKTTGPGKKAREVPVFILRTLSLSGHDWLCVGLELFQQPAFYWERPYFVAAPTKDYSGCVRKFLKPEQLSLHLRGLYTHLLGPRFDGSVWRADEFFLVPVDVQNFWSGHSARHWLPSWGTALGLPKCDLDYLGRWQAGAHQSTEYVVKAREVVYRVQKRVNEALCLGHESVSELELFEDLKRYCADRGVSSLRGVTGHQIWRRSDAGHLALLTRFPLLIATLAVDDRAEAALVAGSEPASNQEGRFWYSISRRTGFRRLHLTNGCGVLPWSVHEAVFVASVEEAKADAWCKICQRKVAEEESSASSSSGSSSSTATEENEGAAEEGSFQDGPPSFE